MAKRLRDTMIWDKPWFRKLSPKFKCFVDYILSRCDIAGLWVPDFETASYYIGESISEKEIPEEIKNQLGIQIIDSDKWFVAEFIPFQYGQVTEKHKMYKAINNVLSKYGIDTLSIVYQYSIDTVKDKDKDKDMDKDTDKDKRKDKENKMDGDASGRKRFTPPSPEEVQAYCDERNNGIRGQDFVDFYISKGWKVGNSPMKDWRAAVRTWESRRRESNTENEQPLPKRISAAAYRKAAQVQ